MRNIIDVMRISHLFYILYKYILNMFLLSLVYLYFAANSLKCPLRVPNCCISLGPRQVVPHVPELIQVLPLYWAGCWEAQNCCQVSRTYWFKCLSFKHVQAIPFSSVTTFFLIFIRFSFWKKPIIRNAEEWRLCAFLDSKISIDFSMSRFSLWALHHICYADGISSCTDPAAGPGQAEAALISFMLPITSLPAELHKLLTTESSRWRTRQKTFSGTWKDGKAGECKSKCQDKQYKDFFFPFQEAEGKIAWKCAVLMDSLLIIKTGVSETLGNKNSWPKLRNMNLTGASCGCGDEGSRRGFLK